LTGEPGTLPPTWCKRCQAEVKPEGKGRCPRCNTFLKLNFAARRHPVNKLRCRQLLDQFLAEYAPTTTLGRSTCEQLAGIIEQLEVLKPGSPEHQRLVQLAQQLGETLEASRPPRTTLPDVSNKSPAELRQQAYRLLRMIDYLEDVEASTMPLPVNTPSELALENVNETTAPESSSPATTTTPTPNDETSGDVSLKERDPEL
jgi:hypothetical protein